MAESLEARLDKLITTDAERTEKGLTGKQIKEGRRLLTQEVKEIFSFLERTGEYLQQEGYANGVIELGTKEDEINWGNMSEGLRQAFQPEFTFQPEEITSFKISCSGKTGGNGERNIVIDLQRNGMPWSYVHAGAIVRDNYVAPSIYANSQTPIAQVKAARMGLEALKPGYKNCQEKRESQLLHDQEELSILKDVLNFAVTELESRPASK